MVLTVRDILGLPRGQKMSLTVGKKGLDRTVVTVALAEISRKLLLPCTVTRIRSDIVLEGSVI